MPTLRSAGGRILGMEGTNVVKNERGTYDVIFDGETIKSGFTTEDACWEWYDSQNTEDADADATILDGFGPAEGLLGGNA